MVAKRLLLYYCTGNRHIHQQALPSLALPRRPPAIPSRELANRWTSSALLHFSLAFDRIGKELLAAKPRQISEYNAHGRDGWELPATRSLQELHVVLSLWLSFHPVR